MIIGKFFRVLLYSAFILNYGFVFFKHFLPSSARGGLLDTILFVSSSPADINNYKAGDHHTALGLWVLYGLELPSLALEDIYRIAYQKKFEGKDEYLINEKIICVSNDSSCWENFITKKAINDRNYLLLLDILSERFVPECEEGNFICGSLKSFLTRKQSLDRQTYLMEDHTHTSINEDHTISYLPFAGYHFDKMKRGELFFHEVFPNRNETFQLYEIMVRGEAFENFTTQKICRKSGKDIIIYGILYEFDQDVEDIDVVFIKSSYGRGFPYTAAYGPVDRTMKKQGLAEWLMEVDELRLC